jgi:hypothetical protein
METIKIKWNGREVTLTDDMAFQITDAVEDVMTFGQLVRMRSDSHNIKFAKLAKAYSAMLGAVGIKATDAEVYKAFAAQLRGDNGETGVDRVEYAVQVLDWLIVTMLDGAPQGDGDADDGDEGNAQAPAS